MNNQYQFFQIKTWDIKKIFIYIISGRWKGAKIGEKKCQKGPEANFIPESELGLENFDKKFVEKRKSCSGPEKIDTKKLGQTQRAREDTTETR